ncbi:MAG: EamA family transporter [Armatimonadetes bacterium]|nr:EamA family transporter [Armatimonadota bacterium]MDE2206616.1 EamA family transporter [Armatimonadota bacterium]
MTPAKARVLLIMLVAVLAVSCGEALLAKGMKQTAGASGAAAIRAAAANPRVICGVCLMAVYFALYMLALRWADLSFVLPITALSYLLGAILARLYLHEHVTAVRWIGAIVITIGVIIVGLGDAGPHAAP